MKHRTNDDPAKASPETGADDIDKGWVGTHSPQPLEFKSSWGMTNVDVDRIGRIRPRKGFKTFRGMVRQLWEINQRYAHLNARGDFTVTLPLKSGGFKLSARGRGERSVSTQTNDLLETERERTLDMVEAGLPKEKKHVVLHEPIQGVDRYWLEGRAQGEFEGYNEYRTHTLKVIERLRLSSLRINPTVPTEAKHGKGEHSA